MRPRISLRGSVRPSIHPSVGPAVTRVFPSTVFDLGDGMGGSVRGEGGEGKGAVHGGGGGEKGGGAHLRFGVTKLV